MVLLGFDIITIPKNPTKSSKQGWPDRAAWNFAKVGNYHQVDLESDPQDPSCWLALNNFT